VKRPLAPWSRASLAGLAVLALGCGRGGSAGAGDDPALAAIQARIPPLPAAEVSPAPGFLAGGVVYIGVRPGKLQRFLQSLPLSPDVVRDLARAGNELGFDPRVDDVTARLGVDPDALVTMTLLRPLATHAPAVRQALQRGATLPDPFPALGATPSDIGPRPSPRRPPPPIPPPTPPPDPFPAATAGDYDRFDPPSIPPSIPPPAPPPITKPTTDQLELARKAGALGTHSRMHVPVKDASLLTGPLRRALERGGRAPELAAVCGQVGPSDLCTGGGSDLLVVRSGDGAVVFDFFDFNAGTGAAWDPERVAVVTDALRSAAVASNPVLSTLRGDFAVYADADALPGLHEVLSLGEAVGRLSWSPQDVQRKLDAGSKLAQLREVRRLFQGARLEFVVDGETAQATFQWEPRDDAARDQLTRLLTRTPAAASVPTIAGLCDGSLACARTAGYPSLAAFEELATGVYARPSREFGDVVDDADEFGALVLLLETWPNALGAVQRWPKQEGGKIEVAMIGQVLEAIGRVEGTGASLRSLQVGDRRASADYVVYQRLHGGDLALIRSLLGFAGVRFSQVTLPQVPGKVDQAQLPDSDVPATFLLVTDPGTVRAGDKDIEVGWAVVADATDRLTWMLGLERSAATQPAFYAELPDLWRLISSIEDGPRELNFAQGWLSGRSLRIAGDVIGGRLRIDVQLARDAAAK
jgi:hypothetical protein